LIRVQYFRRFKTVLTLAGETGVDTGGVRRATIVCESSTSGWIGCGVVRSICVTPVFELSVMLDFVLAATVGGVVALEVVVVFV
jgi:hypothetical protein